MKRILLLFAALLLGLTLPAQNGIDGTWLLRETENEHMDETDGKVTMESVMTMRFRFDGGRYELSVGATLAMNIRGKDKNGKAVDAVITLGLSGDNGGELARSGARLTLTPDKSRKPKVDVEADVQGFPGGGLVKSMMSGQMKKEIVAELKKTREFRIISVTPSELTLEEILTEKERRKGETPERKVWLRQ